MDKILKITNLRTARAPADPWDVKGKELSATVKAKTVSGDAEKANIQLDVDLTAAGAWRLISVSPQSPHVSFKISPENEKGSTSRHLVVEFTAPRDCPVTSKREAVVLTIRYEVKGKEKIEELELDYRCLLGDTLEPSPDLFAAQAAKLAQKYRKDPLIQDLTSRASFFKKGTLLEELGRLRKWVRHSENSYVSDPYNLEGTRYVLSPTETYRYGGDCEDWAILAGAFLAERGFEPWIAAIQSHVWVNVEGIDVDLTNEKLRDSGYLHLPLLDSVYHSGVTFAAIDEDPTTMKHPFYGFGK